MLSLGVRTCWTVIDLRVRVSYMMLLVHIHLDLLFMPSSLSPVFPVILHRVSLSKTRIALKQSVNSTVSLVGTSDCVSIR